MPKYVRVPISCGEETCGDCRYLEYDTCLLFSEWLGFPFEGTIHRCERCRQAELPEPPESPKYILE